jgi:adhesin transport system membrane fusion protein
MSEPMAADSDDEVAPEDRVGAAIHFFFILCAAMCVAFVVWASIGTLDIVSMAQGEVIPSSQVKSVQHLEGGIVRRIMVREGERVKKNQPLVELEPTTSGADVGELQVRLDSLKADILRLEAEGADKDVLVSPQDFRRSNPRLVAQAQERFTVRRKGQKNRMNSQRETIIQRGHELAVIRARIKTAQGQLKFQDEQIKISEELLKQDLTSRYIHLDLLKKGSELRGGIEQDRASLSAGASALKEAASNLESITSAYKEEITKELREVRVNFEELTRRIEKYADSLNRTVVRSPVEGVVKTLYVVTLGGVVKPGGPVVDIVPGEDRLIIEAKLMPQDIGYVRAGQSANIKLASADATRFGGMDGTVVSVSPDTLTTPEGEPYYKVRIETAKDHFSHGKLRYYLFPGMQVMASIETGERTVLQYIIDPLQGYASDAMQER